MTFVDLFLSVFERNMLKDFKGFSEKEKAELLLCLEVMFVNMRIEVAMITCFCD